MTWAWSISLPPTPKLVLMALADEADDRGFCFPSIRHVASKCSMTPRSVQRLIRRLAQDRLVVIERRFTKDRARTSNGYRLAVDYPRQIVRGPMTTQSPGGPLTGGGRHRGQGGGDSGVGVTTTYPSIYPNPPLPEPAHPANACGGVGCGGASDGLCFPRALSDAQRQALARHTGSLHPEIAQQILDELAGRMGSAQVRNPVRYCAALVRRLNAGTFEPELGREVAERRRAECERMRRREHSLELLAAEPGATLPRAMRMTLQRIRTSAEARREANARKSAPSTDGPNKSSG